LARQLFSGLAQLTPQLDIVPDVARSWEMLDGGRRYILHLREDTHWSDGAPVTAGDFECGWKMALHPSSPAPLARLLYDIKGARPYHNGQVSDPASVGVRALDDLTLDVELEGPTGYFLQLVACGATYPMPRHVVEAFGESWSGPAHLVTNGPFRLQRWDRHQSIILERNPDYHGQFGGNVHQMVFPFRPAFEAKDSYCDLTWYERDDLDVLHLFAYLAAVASRNSL
jgi:oligopeptide transport system substrate-binding protein